MGIDRVDTTNIVANAVSAAKLSAALQDVIPHIYMAGVDNANLTGDMILQVTDAGNNSLHERFLIRTWVADAAFSEPDPQNGFAVLVGEQMVGRIEANADLEVITTAAGVCEVRITVPAPKTVHVMAEIDGRIYTASIAITAIL